MSETYRNQVSISQKPMPQLPNIPDALFSIQHEFKKFERDKTSWSIEKSELKARIQVLEGECQAHENLKADLMRRIKMLEYALRKERSKNGDSSYPQALPMETDGSTNAVSDGRDRLPSSNLANPTIARSKKVLQSCLLQFETICKDFKEDPKLEATILSRNTSNPLKKFASNVVEGKKTSPMDESGDSRFTQRNNYDAPPSRSGLDEDDSSDEEENLKGKPKLGDRMKKSIKEFERRTNGNLRSSHATSISLEKRDKDLDELGRLSIDDANSADDQKSSTMKENRKFEPKSWKPKFTLRSHLDSVRSVVFHSTRNILISGSEDSTIKLWSIDSLSKKNATDIEPILTYRGHTKGVTSLHVSPINEEILYSSGMDSVIRSWKLASFDRLPYASFDPDMGLNEYVGHTDIVWQVKSHFQKDVFASISADRTIKLWRGSSANPLLSSWMGYPENPDVFPTCIDFVPHNPNQILVSFSNSALHMYDMETNDKLLSFDSQTSSDFTPATQINTFLSHPTLPIIVSGHEDRYIRFFSYDRGKCLHSMVAHLDSVQTLDIHPSGLTLVSAGHDASVRFWDLNTKSCMQEFNSHRKKFDEAINSVKYHNSHPYLATGGADSTVKLYV